MDENKKKALEILSVILLASSALLTSVSISANSTVEMLNANFESTKLLVILIGIERTPEKEELIENYLQELAEKIENKRSEGLIAGIVATISFVAGIVILFTLVIKTKFRLKE